MMTTLEKIRAELENQTIDLKNGMISIGCVMAIIDKYAEQEPTEDYEYEIDRLQKWLDIAEYDKERLKEKIKALEQEPKTGRWLRTGETDVYYDLPSYECNKCGQYSLENGNYCPNCGAKMESEEISERNLKMWQDIFEEEKRRTE